MERKILFLVPLLSGLLLLGLAAACDLPQPTPRTLPAATNASALAPTRSAMAASAFAPANSPTLSSPALTAGPAPENVQDIIDRCPTAAEVAAVDADLKLGFIGDLTAGNLICRAADGSADLTLLQERAYQVLVVMQRLKFDQPLPWTDLSLYDWFTSNIDSIRFDSANEYSSCCNPPRTMNLITSLFALETDRWLQVGDPDTNVEGLMVLMIHEARHSDGHYHTCGPAKDKTIAELGSFGVQYYTYLWLAYHSDPAFMTPGEPQPNLYREINRDMAIRFRMSSDAGNGPFCQEATLTPGASPTVR